MSESWSLLDRVMNFVDRHIGGMGTEPHGGRKRRPDESGGGDGMFLATTGSSDGGDTGSGDCGSGDGGGGDCGGGGDGGGGGGD